MRVKEELISGVGEAEVTRTLAARTKAMESMLEGLRELLEVDLREDVE
jgi:hypothetical protein